jgi:iron complex transport system ATP-binding protein
MSGVLEARALSVGYRTVGKASVVVAEALTLTLNRGELVCLLGPNGAGKSTLMRTLAGMQPPLAGHVLLNKDDLNTLDARQRAQRLSIVLTERPNLGLLNGYALVALGRHPYTDWMGRLSRRDEAVVRWAVEVVGAADFADRPVMQLSDGQRQKLMIARALAQESELILLDEPTAFLDLPRRVDIMRLLRHLAAQTGRTILLSTHDLDLALRSADRLWLMSYGRVRVGTPEDLVLGGAFEEAFRSEGVAFDRESGAFRVEDEGGRAVVVAGHGAANTWTRRALKRAGFTLAVSGQPPPIRVDVGGDDTRPIWTLCVAGEQTIHDSIDNLLWALRSAVSKRGGEDDDRSTTG